MNPSIKSPSDTVAIPEGFASLDDAKRWEAGLRKAEEALDSLFAQRWIYAAADLLSLPLVAQIQASPSRTGPGLELGLLVHWGQERVELGALMAKLFRAQYEAVGLVESARALESLLDRARELERWTRERPSMLQCLPTLAQARCGAPLALDSGSSWGRLCQALGASKAAAGMERAQLAQAAKDARAAERGSL